MLFGGLKNANIPNVLASTSLGGSCDVFPLYADGKNFEWDMMAPKVIGIFKHFHIFLWLRNTLYFYEDEKNLPKS